MRRLLFLAAAILMIASPFAFARRGGGAADTSGSPLALPLLTQSQAGSMFTFLGSFTVPDSGFHGFAYGGSAISVSGTTMYMASLAYDPATGSSVNGIGSFTIPTLSGTPAYDGSNGSVNSTTIVGPNAPGVMAPVAYTLSAPVSAGATSAQLATLPPGIAANAGWYVYFSNSDIYEITGINGTTVSWATGTTNSYSGSVNIFEWNTYGNLTYADGTQEIINGSYVSNGTLYLTGSAKYDGNCTESRGFVETVNATTLGPTWGAANPAEFSSSSVNSNGDAITGISWSAGTVTVTGAAIPAGVAIGSTFPGAISGVSPSGYDGTFTMTYTSATTATYALATNPGTETALGTIYSTANSRYLSGPLYPTPPIWQTLLGQDYVGGGVGNSVIGCAQSVGPAFYEFNLANVSNNFAMVPVSIALQYPQIATGNSLVGRKFAGPFPLNTTTGYYPATLTTAPAQNDTSVQITLPTATVSFSVSGITTGGEMTVTSFNSGPAFSNTGISYTLAGTGLPSNAEAQPSFDYAPGTTLTTGTYWEGDAPTTAIGAETITATPIGYEGIGGGATTWTMYFSDGESRVGSVNSSGLFTFSPALTGCTTVSPCTTSVTMGPMGDALFSEYDGDNSGGFFVPGTSTYMAMGLHSYGIQRPKSGESTCDPGSSESWWTPLAPDTNAYQEFELYLYKAQDLVNGANGSQSLYAATPYGHLEMPDSASLVTGSCWLPVMGTWGSGRGYFDPNTNIFYLSVGQFPTYVYEWKVTPP